jgi:hypothetical protein
VSNFFRALAVEAGSFLIRAYVRAHAALRIQPRQKSVHLSGEGPNRVLLVEISRSALYSLRPKLIECFDWNTNIKESMRNL